MADFKRSFAVIIGINQYANGIPTLLTPTNDATQITALLQSKYGYQVLLLLDTKATYLHLSRLFTALQQQTLPLSDNHQIRLQSDDRLLFYFAGHGIALDALDNADGPAGFIVPQDARLNDNSTLLPMTQLHETLWQLPCRHLLVILDCCFAGTFRWAEPQRDVVCSRKLYRERYRRYLESFAQQVITSAADDEKAADVLYRFGTRSNHDGHSPFAELLLQALGGAADMTKDGVITATELYAYLQSEFCKTNARQTPGFFQLKQHDKGEYIFVIPNFEPEKLPAAPKLDETSNPYRGLASFEVEHSNLFFGRTALTEKLQEFIKSHPLTVVLGTSGSGKSSLVKAGLIPKLQKSQQKWRILGPIRLGVSPFRALNQALKQENMPIFELPSEITNIGSPSSKSAASVLPKPKQEKSQNFPFPQLSLFWKRHGQNDESFMKGKHLELKPGHWYEKGLRNLAQSLQTWSQNYPDSKLLLAIDQCEELITLCQNDTERQRFLNGLARALAAYPEQLRIIFTLRSDFEPQLRNTPLESYWNRARFIVPAMVRSELRQAIEEPATARVMYFEPPALVEQLIDEVAQMPGALPLLSFSLSELYLKSIRSIQEGQRNNRAITVADYEELGGVTRSLTQRADQEYDRLVNLNPAYAQTIKQVMLRMIAVSGGELVRRQVPVSELEYPEPENQRVQHVIQHFCDVRLLVKGQNIAGDFYVEPAHDVLVRGWPRLLSWRKQAQEGLLLQRRLSPAAEEWQASKHKVKFLLSPTDPYLPVLKQILNSSPDNNWFNKVEVEFVKESLRRQRNQRLWTSAWITVGFVAVLSFAFYEWQNSQDAEIRSLTKSSEVLFSLDEQLDSLIEALKAAKQLQWTIEPVPDTQKEVETTLQQAVYWVREHNRLIGHTSTVNSVSFSPDGEILASASSDRTIKLWRKDGNEIKTISYVAPLYSVSFSPDGTLLAAGASNNTITLWTRDGKYLKALKGHSEVVNNISFSPDGKFLASASSDKTIKLWTRDGQLLKTLKGHRSPVYAVNFSPNGKLLAAASSDNTIKLWTRDGKALRTFPKLSAAIYDVKFSPDGQLLASASSDNTIRLWTLDGKSTKTLRGHSDTVSSLSFSPDGKILASGSCDHTIKLWNRDGKELKTLRRHRDVVYDVTFSPDGKTLASASWDNTIKLWTIESQNITGLVGHTGSVNSVSFSPNGQVIASASSDNTIRLWNLGGKELKKLVGHGNTVNSVSFSPNGKLIASGSWDNTIKLWTLEGKELQTFKGHKDIVNSVSFSPDSKMLVSGSRDNTIKLWNLDGRELKTFKGHKDTVNSVSFSPDGKMIASTSRDKTIKIWDLNGQEIKTLQVEDQHTSVKSLSFSPNGKLLAAASWNNTIKVWFLDGKEPPQTLTGHQGTVNSLSFSPDGKKLASASSDKTIKIWSLQDGKELRTLKGHEDTVNSVSFSPNGQILASASRDKVILLWKLHQLASDDSSLVNQGCSLLHDYLHNRNADLNLEVRHLCG